MIDITPYEKRLSDLKTYLDAFIELKVWYHQPLKPFPYESFYAIETGSIKFMIDDYNRKYKTK